MVVQGKSTQSQSGLGQKDRDDFWRHFGARKKKRRDKGNNFDLTYESCYRYQLALIGYFDAMTVKKKNW